jgi:hypothetical protein
MRLDLGPVILDTDRRQVLRGVQPLRVSKKAFALLELLVEKRPSAVSKEEIQRALWPRTFVSDASLTTLVNEVRKLLAESAREHRLIRTVHGFGYAFEGPTGPAPGSGCRLVWGEREVPLEDGENILGRSPRGRGAIPDTSISRRHARITIRAGAATLEDLGSKNGTYLGEERVSGPVTLSDGDDIRLGLVRFVFRAAPECDSGTTRTVR